MGGTYKRGEKRQLSDHFSTTEMQCKCGECIDQKISLKLLAKLEELRELIGRPIKVNSAYRCLEHNREVGSNDHSQHPKGTAADIVVRGMDTYKLEGLAKRIGFNGVGWYPTFVHVDVRPIVWVNDIAYWRDK